MTSTTYYQSVPFPLEEHPHKDVPLQIFHSQFTKIVHDWTPHLQYRAWQITKNQHAAEDIVQEAFLALWQQTAKSIPDNPVGWLHKVVSNLGYKYLRRSSVQLRALNTLGSERTSCYSNVEERLIEKEHDNLLNKAFSQLSHRQQMVFHLSREKGLRRHEIAARLNLSPNTVKVHLLRALQFMKEHIACFILFLSFFVFNNLFFSKGNTNASPGELYNVGKVIEKDLPEKMEDQESTDRSVSGKQLSMTVIVSLVK